MTEKIKLDTEDKSDEFNDRVNEKDEAKQKFLIADQLLIQRGLTPPAHFKEELHLTNNADSITAAENDENEDPKTKSQQASDVIKPYVAVEFNHLPGKLPEENNDDETDESFALMKDASATNGYVPVQQIADYLVYNERFEVDPRQIKKERRIGEGFYGDVYLGTLSRSEENIQVAIKMAKDEKSVLRDEMKILMYLQSEIEHENVLRLLGAVTKSRNEFCILTEFCEFGSLDSFLERKYDGGEFVDEIIVQENNEQQQLLEQTWKAQQDPSWTEKYRSRRESGLITTSDLLWFALQIARAMQFLAEKKVCLTSFISKNFALFVL
uniref:Protein kinase domain-containing protein n=1 Tax=Plectus sambesii TaxID=2011161 RepID=A0A914WN68_9BILA